MRSLVLILACAAGTVAAQVSAQYLPETPYGKPELAGVWVVSGSTNLPDDLPYRPEALKLWQERKANLTKDDPATYCLPNGVVRITSLPYKIVQTPQLIVILSEGNTHSFRRIFLDGRAHNLDLEPNSWTGDSIGKWEGNALVVDTIGFNDRTWLDDTGKPHSDQLHVIERYRRPDAGRLVVDYTLEDPKFLTKPYMFSRTFVPAKREIQERFCTEQNH
ncbi:MAG: hypothetical protein ACRD4E_05990, partial [Bryobacteraceae bacterium]